MCKLSNVVMQYLMIGEISSFWLNILFPLANSKPLLEMENEEKIRLEARRRLEEQLKQYRVQRHKERVSKQWQSVLPCVCEVIMIPWPVFSFI